MSDEQGYNGWKNYETWAMALWIDNEESAYNYARELAVEARETAEEGHSVWTPEEHARFALADALKEWQEQTMPAWTGEASVWVDLLNAAFSEIDWDEVARHYLDES